MKEEWQLYIVLMLALLFILYMIPLGELFELY